MKKTTVLSLLLLTAGMASAQTLDYTIPSGQTLQFSTSPVNASVLRQDTSLSGHITPTTRFDTPYRLPASYIMHSAAAVTSQG